MSETAIEWATHTWNPITGCSKVSPGCAHCYAETLATRLHRMGQRGYTDLPWTPENAEANVFLHPERLDQPLRWRRPRMVFVNSMSDLFHERIPDEFIAAVFAVMALAHWHTFQVLTKRPERMRDLLKSWRFCKQTMQSIMEAPRSDIVPNAFVIADELSERSFGEVLTNVWLGVSIENRRYVDRADVLRQTPAAVRFISAEPLLGPLIAPMWKGGMPLWKAGKRGPQLDLTDIAWLIVGGESGPEHRPMNPQWARDLREAASAEGTAFFFKQWGGRTPKAGGCLLDGREWKEMPR